MDEENIFHQWKKEWSEPRKLESYGGLLSPLFYLQSRVIILEDVLLPGLCFLSLAQVEYSWDRRESAFEQVDFQDNVTLA